MERFEIVQKNFEISVIRRELAKPIVKIDIRFGNDFLPDFLGWIRLAE